MSIRTRVTLFGLGVVALLLVVVSVLFLVLVVGTGGQGQDEALAARAEAALASLRSAPAADFTSRAPLAPADAATGEEIVVVVLDDRGAVLATDGVVDGVAPTVPAGMRTRADRNGRAGGTVAVGGVYVRVHVRPWTRADLGRSGYVVTAQALERLRTDRAGLVAILVVADVVGLTAGAVAIWLATGRALRPLRQLTATAHEVGRSADLGRRLPPVRQRDDVGRLTASFNTMMGRLQQASTRMAETLAAQQRFTADASHELRTPLTSIRSNAGFLRANPDAAPADRAAALADIEAESARMSRLMDDLLALARADAGQVLRREPVDLEELVSEVVDKARALHPGRTFAAAGVPATIVGDAEALRRLLWILVDNAVAHTGDSGSVWIATTRAGRVGVPGGVPPGAPGGGARPAGGPAADRVVVQVSDDGTGIPPGLHARVFDRFFRADESRRRGGAGLGLSIAAWIAAASGGRIQARDNDRGGATFVVELPGADPRRAPAVPGAAVGAGAVPTAAPSSSNS